MFDVYLSDASALFINKFFDMNRLLILSFFLCSVRGYVIPAEERLADDVTKRINKGARPPQPDGGPVPVSIAVGLSEGHLTKADGKEAELSGTLVFFYQDTRLAWDPQDYRGISNAHPNISNFCVPSVSITNGISDSPQTPLFNGNAAYPPLLSSNGTIILGESFTTVTSCVRYEYYGKVRLVCPIVILQFGYTASEVQLSDTPPIPPKLISADLAYMGYKVVVDTLPLASFSGPFSQLTYNLEFEVISQPTADSSVATSGSSSGSSSVDSSGGQSSMPYYKASQSSGTSYGSDNSQSSYGASVAFKNYG